MFLRQIALVFICGILAGCANERTYRGYEIIDPEDHNYVLVTGDDTIIGPQIKKWNVWNEYIFLYKTARPGGYSELPYTNESGYAIVNTTSGIVQFFESKDLFEAEVKKLRPPEDRLILQNIPGKWLPNKQESETSETASSQTPPTIPDENPAAANPRYLLGI